MKPEGVLFMEAKTEFQCPTNLWAKYNHTWHTDNAEVLVE